MEYNDIELSLMFKENDEDAKDIIYDKYNYIIDIIFAKYKKTFYTLGMDLREVKQECLLAFTDAIIRYTQDKETSLATFISLVVERKVQNCIRYAESTKARKNKENYSLEFEYEFFNRPLKELIGDPNSDPLFEIETQESYDELVSKIKSSLSPSEYEVYELLINDFNYMDIAKILDKEPKQVDNSIQRIRTKIRDLL